jgi:hypothetical protein
MYPVYGSLRAKAVGASRTGKKGKFVALQHTISVFLPKSSIDECDVKCPC